MATDFLARVSKTYAEHPLTAETILQRVRRRRGTLDGLTEMDLAVDDTHVTDQNHVGGVAAVTALARAVGLRGGENVLDVGTGLGGTPRLLAHLHGCRCHGVELTTTRYRGAVELTHLVGLEKLVTFTRADFLKAAIPDGPFDVVIGQDAFMHFADHLRLLRKCAALLRPGGWLAVQDGYLRRDTSGTEEERKLETLLGCWNGRFHTMARWAEWLVEAGLERARFEDVSELSRAELSERVQRAEAALLESVTETELLGWRLGSELNASGLIGSMRLLARPVRAT